MPVSASSRLAVAFHYSVLGLASLVVLGPVLWALSTSLKPSAEVLSFPPTLVPKSPTLDNYAGVFASGFMRYFFNSLLVTLGTVALCLLVAAHAAYASARFSFRGKDSLLFAILGSGMIPGIAILIPLYLLAVALGIADTFLALILIYAAWQTPLAMWTLRGFFERVPSEIEEAALVDGCSRLRAFYQIVLPLAGPGLAASGIYIFIETWNEFLIAVSLISSDEKRLLTVGLYQYVTSFGIEWGLLTAASIVSVLPVLILFLGMQRLFVSGLTGGAVKG
jgi:ABC-type glycerol-3-phosphate transport system permease component